MNKPDEHSDPTVQSEQEPRRLHLPGFIAGEEIGLGDVIKRATSYVGIKPCGACQRRAAALNRRVVITGRRGQPRLTD